MALPRPANALGILLCAALVVDPGPLAAQQAGGRSGTTALANLSRSFEDLAARVSPSVVQLFVTGYGPADDSSESSEPAVRRSTGSGVIVDADGYIVTNAHVVAHATRIEVELPLAASGIPRGTSILPPRPRATGARIVAIDTETDLAVLKVDAKGLPALPFGDSDALRPGQLVLAVGSPLGLASSVTMGVVSAVARQLTPENPMIYIQTDAPINPGNSGGALVDTEGRLVGINTLIFSRSGGSDGIGFAAPSNIVRNVFTQISTTGRVHRGEVGVAAQTVTPVMAEALGLPREAAVVLGDVFPGGPASAAGLFPGDVVLALDGKRMENGRQFRINVYSRAAGEQVTLDILRNGQRLQVQVPVVARDEQAARLGALVTPANAISTLGVVALDLTPAVAAMMPPLRQPGGVVVAAVSPGAPYSQQGGLQPGDVIHMLNGNPIDSMQTLRRLVAALKPGSAVALQLERRGTLMFVSFRAG